MLLEERMKLARSAGTAPYAICGDLTLKKIVATRPSTKARLANIDGVNQHLVTRYGDHLLQSIQQLSKQLDLSLDGAAAVEASQANNNCKAYTITKQPKDLPPAKYGAWKMWQEDGLSAEKIANFPGRSAPIKVNTVLGYVLDAAREGCVVDWTRLFNEIGLTQEIAANIQAAILKVGSKDKLKPIKEELPEEVDYTHIKAWLTMQDLGMSTEVIPSSNQHSKQHSNGTEESERAAVAYLSEEERNRTERPVPEKTEASLFGDSPRKRQKVEVSEQGAGSSLEITEASLLDWIQNFENGVTLSDILKHFNGSTEATAIDLLSCIESEFLIFKKNNLYKLM
ncbi:uncharacterized protein LOC112512745 isoform X2 [Cynara cardunculus var. scolymus]|nr:uncharacterized protein LOC112512745 isoform X2 [Cynara cardunculus var. scolymus]